MNDTELDEMLDHWNVPAPSPTLRESVRTGFAAAKPVTPPPAVPVRWKFAFVPAARKTLLAAAIVIAGIFLFAAAQALSQTPPPVHMPFTVDSEYLLYGDDGSPTVAMLSTSYTAPPGQEVLLSRSIPGQPIGTALGRALDAALPVLQRMILPHVVTPGKDMELDRKMKQSGFQLGVVIPGCADWTCLLIQHFGFRKPVGGFGTTACMEGTVVGSETILNHPTTAVQLPMRPNRMTLWLAPDMGCFALRITSETMRPDGSFRVWQMKQAVKVTMNP
jgi:hypothetical protein